MKAAEILRAARDVIEAGWCVGSNARDAAGNPVQLMTGADRVRINPLAASFSLYGAICKAGESQQQEQPALMWEVLARHCRVVAGVPGGTNHLHPVIGINEMPGQTVDVILRALDDTINELDPPLQITDGNSSLQEDQP